VRLFGKTYPTEEVGLRFSAFSANMKMIEEHNAKKLGWWMSVNEFTDLSPEEFSATYTGYLPRQNEYSRSRNAHVVPEGQIFADSVDWRTKGAVTPVKDQGQCGSCWAFSTTGSVEGAVFLKSGTLTSLSEQELVDCAGSAGNQGCNGGLMDDAFEFIIKNGGLASEASYPYKAKDGTCQKKPSVSTITGYKDITKGDETGLLSAVNIEPTSIAVDAAAGWQTYGGGIMAGLCGKSLDHGVLAVGYGADGSQNYWIVKNSWGSSWGESGYIRLARGKNECGLAQAASYPVA